MGTLDIRPKRFGFQTGPGNTGFCEVGFPVTVDGPMGPEVKQAEDGLMLRVCGGRGSMKTYGALDRDASYALNFPGAWGMIITLTKFKHRDTIIPKFQKLMKDWQLRPNVHYDLNINLGEYTFYNGSKIFLRTAQEPENLPGPDMSFIHIDEYREMTERVFTEVMPTLRQPGFPRQCWLASTPGGAAHWSRKIWMPHEYAKDFDVDVPTRRSGRYVNYRAFTKDSPFIPKELYQMWVDQYGGENTRMARQELFGEELVMEGLVYEGFDASKHVVPQDKWPGYPNTIVAGVDFGFKHPAAIIVYGIDECNRRYVLDEFKRSHCDPITLATVAQEMQQRYNIERFICDSEDPGAIHVFRGEPFRLPAFGAQKILRGSADKTSTFGLVERAINQRVQGGQGFFVHPQCKNFRREIEAYVYDKDPRYRDGPEVPRKLNDDLMDALRYAEIWVSQRLVGRSAGRGIGMLDFRIAA